MKNFEYILLCFCLCGLGAANFSTQNKTATIGAVVENEKLAAPGSGRVFSGGKHGLGGIKNAGIMDPDGEINHKSLKNKMGQRRPAGRQDGYAGGRAKKQFSDASTPQSAGVAAKPESKTLNVEEPDGDAFVQGNFPPGVRILFKY